MLPARRRKRPTHPFWFQFGLTVSPSVATKGGRNKANEYSARSATGRALTRERQKTVSQIRQRKSRVTAETKIFRLLRVRRQKGHNCRRPLVLGPFLDVIGSQEA